MVILQSWRNFVAVETLEVSKMEKQLPSAENLTNSLLEKRMYPCEICLKLYCFISIFCVCAYSSVLF